MSRRAVPFSYKRAKPVDLTFEGLTSLDPGAMRAFTSGFVSAYRMLGAPRKVRGRYRTASLLLNNNRLTGPLDGIRAVVDRLFDRPDALCWLDVSHNRLTGIAAELLGFPNLRTLYAHCNELANVCAVEALSRAAALRTCTLSGNPVAAIAGYRTTVVRMLPQLIALDFVVVTREERNRLPPAALQAAVANMRKARQLAVRNGLLYGTERGGGGGGGGA